jgi:hypothetical protein
MSRKVFTAGEVLAAADVNSFLMDQTVMSFAGTAARGSAIPSPVEGMVTYLEDIDDLRTYNGTAWTSPYVLTHIQTTTGTNVAALNLNNVFSSTYTNYYVLSNIQPLASSTLRLRMRVGGVNATGSNYFSNASGINSGGATSFIGNGGDSAQLSRTTISESFYRWDVRNPFLAVNTIWMGQHHTSESVDNLVSGFAHAVGTSYDGFSIFASTGNITGKVQVFGYREQ